MAISARYAGVIAAILAASVSSAADLNYGTVAALSCNDFLDAYGTDLSYSLTRPIITYVTERDPKDRFGNEADIGDYVAIECRLHEKYKIGAAVDDLLDQNRRHSLPPLPLENATQDPGLQAQWDALDMWLHHKGPRPQLKSRPARNPAAPR
jgi:hypothetical protein